MPDWRRLARWIGSRRRSRRETEADMAEEIRLHLEQRTREFLAQGLTPEQARTAARRRFGSVDAVKDACRDERRSAAWLGTCWLDLRHAARSLRRDAAFTVPAVFTLTLGVGLVTLFCSVFNGLLLEPWPLPEPDTLVRGTTGVSPAVYRVLQARSQSIDLAAIASCPSFIDGDAKGTTFRCVSGNYFDTLRVPLVLGRGFRSEEDVTGAPVAVTVIGYALWRDRFSLSPDAIGRTIRLNDVPFRIVGVAAPGATDQPARNVPRLWLPLAAYPLVTADIPSDREFLSNPEYCCVQLAGRLRPSQSPSTVSAELTALNRQIGGETHGRPIVMTGTAEIHQPWEDSAVALVGLILAGVLLVLLVACANTGNLQLARGSRRQPELLIRLSLGASRGRLVRQLLTEGLVLAGAATLLSLVFSSAAVAGMARWLGRDASVALRLLPDWRVAGLSVAIATVAILVTGLGPAYRGTRQVLVANRLTRAPMRARSWFVVVQVALCAVLIVAASLLARGLTRAATLDPGFDADEVASVFVRLSSYQSRESRIAAIQRAVLDALPSADPPVVAEAGARRVFAQVAISGSAERVLSRVASISVSPAYLRLFNARLVAGRLLRDDDSPAQVVVNESFAKRAWPGRSAVGAVFDTGTPQATIGNGSVSETGAPSRASAGTATADGASAGTRRQVVGVVGDMQRENSRPGAPVLPAFFERGDGDRLYVRNDAVMLDRARAAARRIDPAASLEITPLSESFGAGLSDLRVGVGLAVALSASSLVMAAMGIFGIFALVTEERRREVGIRVALGASRAAIVLLMANRAGRALAAGLLAGLIGAAAAAPILRHYLIGVGPHDPAAFLVAGLVLAAAAATATFIPIRRALRTDPAITLRAD